LWVALTSISQARFVANVAYPYGQICRKTQISVFPCGGSFGTGALASRLAFRLVVGFSGAWTRS
jgi:hypothetical protein